MEKYVSIGKILNFHGVQGEAKVGFSQNQQDFLSGLKLLYIKKNLNYEPLKLKSVRFHKNYALIKFEGIDSINDIIPYKGFILYVSEGIVRESLGEDEFLIDELTGLEVYDEKSTKIGVVVGVSNNGANDLISIKSLSKKISMVPFVKELVPEVDIKGGKIIVKNIEGLIE